MNVDLEVYLTVYEGVRRQVTKLNRLRFSTAVALLAGLWERFQDVPAGQLEREGFWQRDPRFVGPGVRSQATRLIYHNILKRKLARWAGLGVEK